MAQFYLLRGLYDYMRGQEESTANETSVVEAVMELFRDAERYRSAIEQVWFENFQLYNNEYDFSQKASWQSKIFLSRIAPSVEFVTALLYSSLLESPEWFTVTTENDSLIEDAAFLQKLLSCLTEILQIRERMEEPIKFALLTGMIVAKVYWMNIDEPNYDPTTNTVTNSRKGTVVTEFLSPFDVYLDPSGRGRFIIHRIRLDYDEVLRLADEGFFDREAVKKLKPPAPTRTGDAYTDYLKEAPKPQSVRQREVELLEFWGDILAPDGTIIERNVMTVIGNGTVVLKRPTPNPFRHGKPPFVIGKLFKRPSSVYGKSMVEDARGAQKALTNFTNLLMDAALFASINAFEVDTSILVRPDDLKSGVYPAKVFFKRTIGNNQPLITPIKLGSLDPALPLVWQLLAQEPYVAMGITEALLGQPRVKGRSTATEILAARNQVMQLIQNAARNIEQSFLEPLLLMVLQTFLQFFSPDTSAHIDKLQRQVPELFKQTPLQRAQYLQHSFAVQVRGLTATLNKLNAINKIQQLFALVSQDPLLMAVIDRVRLLHRLVFLMGLDPKEVFLPLQGQEELLQSLQLAALRQAVEQMAGQLAAMQQPQRGKRRRTSESETEEAEEMTEGAGVPEDILGRLLGGLTGGNLPETE